MIVWERFVVPGLVVSIISYLLGSISFSIIFTKIFKGENSDIRKMGSGNAGATNVFRSVGIRASILTFLFDFAKCAVSIAIGSQIFLYAASITEITATTYVSPRYGAYLAGITCLLGHLYPVYYKFRGGKGVVTAAAMVAMIDWRVFVIDIAIFIILFAIKRIVSLSSIVAIGLHPVMTFLITYFLDYKTGLISAWEIVPGSYVLTSTIFALVIAAIVILKHIPNIRRILKGTERTLY